MSAEKKVPEIAPYPSASSHPGGIVIGNNDKTYIEVGGKKKPILLEPAIHICLGTDHLPSLVNVTGFTTVNGAKVARTFDICGCGAYIISKADNTTSEN